jgi:hypothetical protein
VPSLFTSSGKRLALPRGPWRRRGAAEVAEDETPDPSAEPSAEEATAAESRRPKGYTPSKKELGRTTPKRPSAHVRRPGTTPVVRSRKDLTKEERRALREERRQRRRDITEGMRRGDERYLSARDRGPERALARDLVDSRRTVGTWFFGGALLVLVGSSPAMPPVVQVTANLLWAALAMGVIVDGWFLCRKVRRLVRERYPDSTERMGSLYVYVVMRSITFRRMRVPQPRVGIGDRV